jgi:outer membrane protein OmpA-like peptidoglycan-associated protein
MVLGVGLLWVGCSHPQNPERKDPLNDQVTGQLQPTDPTFLKDDPATRVACASDANCPKGAMCHPERNVCFTSYPPMQVIKLEVTCPLVPVYFAFDSTAIEPEAKKWLDHDTQCLKVRGAKEVVLQGYADKRGEAGYNVDLSRRRADVVRAELQNRGLQIGVTVKGEGETDPVLVGNTEHDFAYNRRVELKSK